METKRMKELRKRFEKDNKKWKAIVINFEPLTKSEVRTNYDSKLHTISQILHKIELDLMSNLHNNLDSPIIIKILEDKNEY